MVEQEPRRWDVTIASGASDPIILDNLPGVQTVMLAPVVTGTGKVQTTLSPVSDVLGGTADWIDWLAGTVSEATMDELRGVTAVRAVWASGQVRMVVRAGQ